MYNPSRGGVRGGADQFSWETVKTDKYRENYLGHSLKAPVGRWQKGKDLSWYARERKDGESSVDPVKSELAAIKKAEEEAMLVALGHNVVKKGSQNLTKEEMREALKRNIGQRSDVDIERVDGLGTRSHRAALLTGSQMKNEGMTFESHQAKNDVANQDERSMSPSSKKKKSKKSSKKHKKEKKAKKHRHSSGTEESDSGHKKSRSITDFEEENDSRPHKLMKKKSKHKHKHISRSSDSETELSKKKSQYKLLKEKRASDTYSVKRRRHDSSESE